jgi:hypothetical protein
LETDAETPQYIQTLPRRGYRFLLPVDSTVRGLSPVTRLIVLPFRMLRPDPEIDFLAFSLPDAVTSSLSGLGSLVVRSSVVASRFGGEPLDPKQIAAEADVDVVRFRRVGGGGFFCFPAMAGDPWLNPLRERSEFGKLLSQARTRYREAAGTFVGVRGDVTLGVASPKELESAS